MKNWILPALFVLWNMDAIAASTGSETPGTLQAAKELGRQKSRFLKGNATSVQAAEGPLSANRADFEKVVGPLLTQSCVGCHGPKKAEGKIRLDQLNPDLLNGPDAERWRKVYNALNKEEMPPEDSTDYKPTAADRANVVQWLGEELRKAAVAHRTSKDHSSFRRLTKYEYEYALEDLLGFKVSFASKLPPETVSEDGFKNRSDLLQISAMQFQSYREIALQALKRATVRGERPEPVTYVVAMSEQMPKLAALKSSKVFEKDDPKSKTFNEQHLWNRQTGQMILPAPVAVAPQNKVAFGQNPPVSPEVWALPQSAQMILNLDRFLPDDGVMRIRIRAGRSTMNPNEYASLRLSLSAHTSNNANFSQVVSARDLPVTASIENPQFIEFDVPLSDIQRNPFRKQTTPFPRRDEFLRIQNIANSAANVAAGEERLKVLIDYVEITAPHYEQWPPKTHTDIFFESKNKGNEQIYGREVLGRFLRRVWRRPAEPSELDAFMGFFAKVRPSVESFEDAMVEVLSTALASPEFLYLTTRQTAEGAKSHQNRISDLEFASRLSVFLWSSIPDEELLQLAEKGKLREPTTLAAQVRRMLEDPRSKRFSRQFADQWLGLDRINNVNHLKNEDLRAAMLEEPVAFFDEVLRQNASVMDFLDSDYAMLNERLAAHYGIGTPKVYGPHFRRVPLSPRSNRGGVLTNAAALTINSDGKDSHPVKRGVWLLQRVLHDPPPPPPPNVPEVDLTDPRILKMTLKERIENHRNQAACASCHSRIDPWGIAFENFDALGAYRTSVNNQPVDATSDLFSRQRLAGIDGLKHYLLTERQDQFAQAMVQKLMAYALGRPLTLGDSPDIEKLTAQLRQKNDRLGDLVHLIVGSDLFQSLD
jgi:mono/diheme cytochrome c family protein